MQQSLHVDVDSSGHTNIRSTPTEHFIHQPVREGKITGMKIMIRNSYVTVPSSGDELVSSPISRGDADYPLMGIEAYSGCFYCLPQL